VNTIVDKPWGHEERWAITEKYLGKILFVEQGHKLSLQYHEQKDETVYVLRGRLLLHVGDKEKQEIKELRMGQSYRIMPGVVHRFEAPPDVDVTLIEVSTPEIDDVVRLQDDYNRVKE
jgi:mannose-6-phosphate isomerase